MAWASLVRCFMPVEKVRISRERSSSRPTWNRTSEARSTAARRGQPAQLGHVDHEVARGHLERQAVELGHVAQAAADLAGVAGGVDAEHLDAARRRGAPGPSSAFISVDLPAPFAPSRPVAALVEARRVTSSSAWTAP